MSKETVKKILVIDNDEYSLLLISDFLIFNNFQAIAAADGRLGLQLAREQQPDLIICDIDMPAPNGYEVLRQLRREPATANILVLFLTFETDIASRRQALQSGANGYLNKPVDLKELLSAIATLLQSN